MKQVRLETGVCHFRIQKSESLLSFLSAVELDELNLVPDLAVAGDWLRTGSVYVDGQRAMTDRDLLSGQIVRLHTRRKRYPAAELGGWRARIAAETEDFLVLDKPSGLPTHATLDNFVENAKYVLEQELGQTLFTTHRLDIPTAGLLILAKTKDAQARINRAFARGQVEKRYHALTSRALPLGMHVHYIDPTTHVPRTISSEPHAGWWECRLEIEETGPHAEGVWHRVRLHTGKTHQIRAQFTALGAPILGDTIYQEEKVCEAGQTRSFGLECYELAFRLGAQEFRFTRPRGLVRP